MGLQRQKGRAAGLLFAGVLSAALLNGSALRAWADDDYPAKQKSAALSNATLDVELSATPLPVALELIKKQIGSFSFVFQGNRSSYGNVTLSVHNRPVTSVLKLIADSAGADIWQEDGIYYIGPKGSHQAPMPQPVDVPALTSPVQKMVPSRVEQIRLNWADARLVVRAVTGEADPSTTVYTSNPALLDMNGLAHTHSSNDMLASPIGSLIKDRNGSTISLVPGYYGDYTAPPAVPTGQGPIGAVNGGAPDASVHRSEGQDYNRGGQLAGGQPGGGFGQNGGQNGGGFGQNGGQNGGFGQNGQNGQNNGIGGARGLLPEGIVPQDLTAISNTNVILVRYPDTPEGELALRELKERIRLLDVKPKQIQVRAQFVTLLQQDADQFGINWQFQKVNLVGQLNAGYSPSGQALLQFATGNLQMQLNFALTTGRGKVVASPMATTFNNVPAQFTNSTTYYAFIPQTFIGPGGAAQTTYLPTPIQASSSLVITPRINGDQTLTLTGNLFFSDVSGTATAPDGTSIPIITSQSVPNVTRIIRNGDTMVLAGLIRKSDNTDTQRVPLLGDLPLIGSLFRSRSINTNDSELLVFITATILNDPIPTGSVNAGAGGLITAPTGPTGNQ